MSTAQYTPGPRINVPKLQELERMGIACPHCGNVVLQRGKCPMRFPLPNCVADVEGVRAILAKATGSAS